IINHQWRSLRKRLGHDLKNTNWFDKGCGWLLTFVAVVIGWVFFRAETMNAALLIVKGMFGFNGLSIAKSLSAKLEFLQSWNIQPDGWLPIIGGKPTDIILFMPLLLIIAWFTPNTQEWMMKFNPTLEDYKNKKEENYQNTFWQKLRWQPNMPFSIILGTIYFLVIKLILEAPNSDFLYFNF
ncbi:MAG: MBOAT family protein, partial [Cyanobacteria bacterium P01_D01_bin.50]